MPTYTIPSTEPSPYPAVTTSHTSLCGSCSYETPDAELDHGLCELCHNEIYTQCVSCEASIHSDDSRYTGSDHGPYCLTCVRLAQDAEDSDYEDREGEDETGSPDIYDHMENVLRHCKFQGEPKDGIFYGLELEVEVEARKYEAAEHFAKALTGYAILKADGSLDSGFEVVTAPATLEVHRKELDARFLSHRTAFREYGVLSAKTDTCGIHVHISRKPLSQLQIGKMQVFLHNPANRSFVETIAQRSCNRWADFSTSKKLWDGASEQDGRYTALNLENKNTVELRIFRGNLRIERVMKCLEFAAALVRWCGTGVTSIGDCADYRSFMKWVAANRKDYPALHAFLIERNLLPAPVSKIKIAFDGKQARLPIIVNSPGDL